MESRRWTDETLDDLADSIRTGFARVDQDIRDLKGEVHATRTELHSGINNTRIELNTEIAELRQWILRLTLGMSLGFITVVVTILARGA